MPPDKKYYMRWRNIWVKELTKELPAAERLKIQQKINTIDIKLGMIDSGQIPGSSMRTRVVMTDSIDMLPSSKISESKILNTFGLTGSFPIFKRDYITVIMNKNRVQFYFGPRLILLYETNLDIEDMKNGFAHVEMLKRESVKYKDQLMLIISEMRAKQMQPLIFEVYMSFSNANKKLPGSDRLVMFIFALLDLSNEMKIQLIKTDSDKLYWFPNGNQYTNMIPLQTLSVSINKVSITKIFQYTQELKMINKKLSNIVLKISNYVSKSQSARKALHIEELSKMITNKMVSLESTLDKYRATKGNELELNTNNHSQLNNMLSTMKSKTKQMILVVNVALNELSQDTINAQMSISLESIYEETLNVLKKIDLIIDDILELIK